MALKRNATIRASVMALALPIVLLANACDRQPASRDAPPVDAGPAVSIQPADATPVPASEGSAEPATPAPAPAPQASAPRPPSRPIGANPSFDCTRAGNNVERMICDDGDLAAADRRLAQAAARAGRFAVLRGDIRSGGRAFLSRRNACADKSCILDEYDEWTGTLQGMIKEQEMIGPSR